jgi:hypothetical protein
VGACALVAGECAGECLGQCSFVSPDGGCEDADTAVCESEASSVIDCLGVCAGRSSVRVTAECEATSHALFALYSSCGTGELQSQYRFSAALRGDANVEARDELGSKMSCYSNALQQTLPLISETDLLLDAVAELQSFGTVAVQAVIEASISDSEDPAALACASSLLPDAEERLAASSDLLQAVASTLVRLLAEH